MSKLEYSSDAFKARSKFLQCDYIIAVENEDDIAFWSIIMESCNVQVKYKIEPKHGVQEVEKFRLEDEDSPYVIARDRDLDFAPGETGGHRCLLTWGYSIENSLCNIHCLTKAIRIGSRDQYTSKDIVEEFINYSERCIGDLVCVDASKIVRNRPLGDNFARFSQKQNSNCHDFDVSEVNRAISRAIHGVSEEELRIEISALKCHTEWFRRLCNGHFLFSLCRRFYESKCNGNKISNHSFMDLMFSIYSSSFDALGEEAEYYRTDLRSVFT